MGTALRTFGATGGWPEVRALAGGLAELDEAVEFTVRWHGDQRRPAGEPYLEHLLEAVRVLVEGVGVSDPDVLRAAVLHDVVEDTGCTADEVRERFGPRVAELVGWVTKDEPAEGQSKAEARAAYLDRLREAPEDALVLKLADRLSNVQRLDTHPRPEKRRTYYRETLTTIVPLARVHPWFHAWFATWAREFAYLDAA